MNKLYEINLIVISFLMLFVFMILFLGYTINEDFKQTKIDNYNICYKLGMDVLYYEKGNLFTPTTLTCLDQVTKEIKKIK